jgi:peptidoglycan/xylan/chitin deacetylase (PgdA/CDA1 family)
MFVQSKGRATLALLTLFGLLSAMLGVLAPAANAAPNTVVTLTFDDGVADAYQAGAMLSDHGMQGTFFVNSGPIGSTGYMTRAQLDSLAAGGHEIGGHTVTHADLVPLSPDEAKRQICNDRVTLLGWGFPVTSFAYPYSSLTPQVETLVQQCGYNSARQVGDIVSPDGCGDCDFAETIPPADPYYTRAPSSVQPDWTLGQLEGLVTQAQQHNGGWVQLVFHHVCDNCGAYAVSPSTLSALLDWLQARVTDGTVAVKPVNQVMTGSVEPGVPGPPPPAPAPYGVNGLTNPGLESSADGVLPDCWQAAGFGTNSYAVTRTRTAHSGSWAAQLSVSSWTSGDRKLVSKLDLGQCSPSVAPGHVYQLSSWYTSSIAVPFVVYYRNASGAWAYWKTSPVQPASSGWRQASWTTPAVPAGATALSFGLTLTGVGTVTTDDYALVDVQPDTTAPAVSLTAPANGATVSGQVPVSATATDNVGVSRVDFAVDGTVIGSSTASPYQVTWNSAAAGNGNHTVTATAYDAAGNASTPSSVTVTSSNGATNMLANASLESAATSVPDCWQLGSSGTNTGTGSRTNDAHTGSWAELITITARTSGDRKLVVRQDAGTCAPAATPGHSYQLSVWYKSTVPVPFVVYYRNASGAWVYWQTSTNQPAASTWQQASWTTAAVPAGATGLSFGLSLAAVGSLTTDDYALVDNG